MMLIRFTVENYRSFDREVVFSMIPGRSKVHKHHIIDGGVPGIDALRLGVIYGANASGKSNLVRAMAFVRSLIVSGTRPRRAIPTEPFRLDSARRAAPSRFEIEFVADGRLYAYGFVVDRRRVHEEWLYDVNSRSERPLFDRTTTEAGEVEVEFGRGLDGSADDEQFMHFVARATRPNQLLLTQGIENNVTAFGPVYAWFNDRFDLIFPDSRHILIAARVHGDARFKEALVGFLREMDTGIEGVCFEPVDEDELRLPGALLDQVLTSFENDVAEGEAEAGRTLFLTAQSGERYLAEQTASGHTQFYALRTERSVAGEAKPVRFDIFEESDGTQRLFDLFPMVWGVEDRVLVVDELERSLHPNLVRRLLTLFLRNQQRSQLILTTHESTLLDFDLLRRDEIWRVERNADGASTLDSLESYKPRHDLDVRKGYLHGRFGGVPIFEPLTEYRTP